MQAISHLIHRDYEAIVQDFVTLQFIPPGTDLKPILPVLAKVFDQVMKQKFNHQRHRLEPCPECTRCLSRMIRWQQFMLQACPHVPNGWASMSDWFCGMIVCSP
jgi:predicted unusual protein kinase regulating ubiquinone biosynthesis (AarF/ABC1/UbiB family)